MARRETGGNVLEQQAAGNSFAGDGLFLVGSEVAPGSYRAQDPADCYWERRSGRSGTSDD